MRNFSRDGAASAGFAMSALPPKADMCSAKWDVRFVPKADSCTAANCRKGQCLFLSLTEVKDFATLFLEAIIAIA